MTQDSTEATKLTSRDLQRCLVGYLRLRSHNCIILGNTYVLDSPWECDMLKVSDSGYFVEYEIKLSAADFQNDFTKHIGIQAKFFDNRLFKHDAYAASTDIMPPHGRKAIPKPKQFYFVMPIDIATKVEIPKHCGLITWKRDHRSWGCEVARIAPNLKCPTRLTQKQIWNLGVKASSKLYRNEEGEVVAFKNDSLEWLS